MLLVGLVAVASSTLMYRSRLMCDHFIFNRYTLHTADIFRNALTVMNICVNLNRKVVDPEKVTTCLVECDGRSMIVYLRSASKW